MVARQRTVLVIGGGPAGLVTLRNLTNLGGFERVEVTERRADVGGVWYLDDDSGQVIISKGLGSTYRGLVGNVLPNTFHSRVIRSPHHHPDSTPHQPFPTLVETRAYLRAFAAPYLQRQGGNRIRLSTEATCVEEREDGTWNVCLNDWNDDLGASREEVWDAVVIAVGWYDNEVRPETEGLKELKEKGVAIHSKWWRGAQGYKAERALVIGNANSSNDIAAQLAETPVYQSIRRPSIARSLNLPDERIHDVAPVAKYALDEDCKVTATLTDGTIIRSIDIVFVGTGYRPYADFVHLLDRDLEALDHNSTATEHGRTQSLMSPPPTPHRTPALHRYILNAHRPSLAFVLPFMCALAWRGEVFYPDTVDERLEFERERLRAIEEFRLIQLNGGGSGGPPAYSLVVVGVRRSAALRADIVAERPELDSVIPKWNDEETKRREWVYSIRVSGVDARSS